MPDVASEGTHPRSLAVALACVPSPGGWTVPTGRRPGWSWLPEQGARANLRAMPRWVRIWYRLPWLDRYAYSWMWWHGGWAVRSTHHRHHHPRRGCANPDARDLAVRWAPPSFPIQADEATPTVAGRPALRCGSRRRCTWHRCRWRAAGRGRRWGRVIGLRAETLAGQRVAAGGHGQLITGHSNGDIR